MELPLWIVRFFDLNYLYQHLETLTRETLVDLILIKQAQLVEKEWEMSERRV